MTDLSCVPVEAMVEELHRRNCSFVLGYVDHLQFNTDPGQATEVVWFLECGGNLPLKLTLGRLLLGHLQDVEAAARSVPAPPPSED